MKTYDFILQGSEATFKNAKNHARGQDWQSIEQTENNSLPYLEYKDTINGIDIWYCYGADIYLFTNEND